MNQADYPYNSLGFLMGRATRMMGKHMKSHLTGLELDLAKEHWLILIHLRKGSGLHQQEIADTFCKDKGTIARAVDLLEKENLIERRPDPTDKRQKLLFLTPKGASLGDLFPPISQEMEKQAFKDIPADQIERFKETLKTIYQNLK
ncbi:MAG: MarR family transcriptional regulator [Saprospiraceae bacterium]|nr:MarR family transcriptional regulator [Saprospiraceae bacterium]